MASVWPDAEPQLAAQSLNSLVHHLQRLLGRPLSGAQLLLHVNGCYRLNFEAGVDVDAIRFATLADDGDRQRREMNLASALESYRCAVDLYRGDLTGGVQVQAVVERERLRSVYLTLLARLAEHSFQEGDYAACQGFAQRSLACEPCREDAHRMLMRCYVRQAERAQALRQYRLCENVLRAEFDAIPEAATTALFDQIRRNPNNP
jgi:DNA-binding SARP family transcriptional activator